MRKRTGGDYWVVRHESGSGELVERFNSKADAINGAVSANDRQEELGYKRNTWGIWSIEWYCYIDEEGRVIKRETLEQLIEWIK